MASPSVKSKLLPSEITELTNIMIALKKQFAVASQQAQTALEVLHQFHDSQTHESTKLQVSPILPNITTNLSEAEASCLYEAEPIEEDYEYWANN